MKIKRIAILTAVLIAAAALFIFVILPYIDENEEESSSINIGVAIYSAEDTFISSMMDSLTKDVAEYEQSTDMRVYLRIFDAEDSQATQNDQIERFIALGYDVLCVNLVDRTDAAFIIDKAMEANIPVIFFNREPVQEDMQKWEKLYYVGSDARESAELEAQIVIDIYLNDPQSIDLNGDGIIQYVMLEGERRHQDAIIRTEISVQKLREAGLILEKLDGGIANWDRSQASALTEQYFTTYENQIELIICNNDDMALGAADAVERMGIDFINIVGIDGTAAGLQALDNGEILGTVVMDLDAHAQTIFDIARTLALGGSVDEVADIQKDKSVRVPMYVVSIHD